MDPRNMKKRGLSIALSSIILAWIILVLTFFLSSYTANIILNQKFSMIILSNNLAKKNELIYGNATATCISSNLCTITIKFSNNGTTISNVVGILILGTTQRNYIQYPAQLMPKQTQTHIYTTSYKPIDVIIITRIGGAYHLPLKIITTRTGVL
jgi:hypothetical protein